MLQNARHYQHISGTLQQCNQRQEGTKSTAFQRKPGPYVRMGNPLWLWRPTPGKEKEVGVKSDQQLNIESKSCFELQEIGFLAFASFRPLSPLPRLNNNRGLENQRKETCQRNRESGILYIWQNLTTSYKQKTVECKGRYKRVLLHGA